MASSLARSKREKRVRAGSSSGLTAPAETLRYLAVFVGVSTCWWVAWTSAIEDGNLASTGVYGGVRGAVGTGGNEATRSVLLFCGRLGVSAGGGAGSAAGMV